MKSKEEILSDIDHTLDQLIQNVAAVRSSSWKMLEPNEIDALQKTQNSLLSRLADRQEKVSSASSPQQWKRLQKKMSLFSQLHIQWVEKMARQFGLKKPPKLRRRLRKKDFPRI
jgi:regulator of replication initiation timing